MSSGRAQLIRALQHVPASVVAATCSVSTRTVRRWADGSRAPDERARTALARFRIETNAWQAPILLGRRA